MLTGTGRPTRAAGLAGRSGMERPPDRALRPGQLRTAPLQVCCPSTRCVAPTVWVGGRRAELGIRSTTCPTRRAARPGRLPCWSDGFTLDMRTGAAMWVTVSTAQGPPHSVHVGTGAHVLGRAPGCHLTIDDPHVSMTHAQLDVADGGAWLADLQSTNGTFVEGRRLQAPVWLAAPSEFHVGQTTVRLAVDEPTRVSGPPTIGPSARAGLWGPPTDPPAPPPPPGRVADAGPVAGRDIAIRGGRDAAGRDLIIHEGLKLQTRMRSSAKNCLRLGCVLLLCGFGLFGYFVITWNNKIFDAVTDPAAEPPTDLPSPLPWLPLGAALMFAGRARM